MSYLTTLAETYHYAGENIHVAAYSINISIARPRKYAYYAS